MKHKGVRIVVKINGFDHLDIDSFMAHLEAQLSGGSYVFEYTPVQKLASTFKIIMTPVEIDDTIEE